MTYTIRPLYRHGIIESERDRKPAERLEPAREAIRKAVALLMDFEQTTSNVWEGLSDEELEAICHAAENALRAAENARNLGLSGYQPSPLEAVSWPRRAR